MAVATAGCAKQYIAPRARTYRCPPGPRDALFSFDAERNCVFGFSTIGQKVEWMRQNPKVCLEVEEIVDK